MRKAASRHYEFYVCSAAAAPRWFVASGSNCNLRAYTLWEESQRITVQRAAAWCTAMCQYVACTGRARAPVMLRRAPHSPALQMLTDLAAKINEEPLPEAVQQNGIAFPRKDALIVHSAQYRVDMPDASFGVPEFTAVPDDAFAEQMDVDVAVPQ